ncbi:MAG: agmatine deiminase family protein [Bacteroidetes bacterium]|nr:agmatine deiminase family protein [Bacteroidota bacterium]
MRYSFTLFVLHLIFCGDVFGQISETELHPLPRHATAEEHAIAPLYVPPPAVRILPPSRPVRTMAEFEELEGIIVRWAYNTQNLLLSQIVDAAQDEGMVWIITRPGTSDSTNIKSYLTSRSIPLTNIEFLSISTNSIWSRDYGPWCVYDTDTDSMAIVDFRYNRPRPQDDAVPVALAQLWNLPLYQTVTMPDSLSHTGGNYMVDGSGRGFASKLIYFENRLQSMDRIDSILLRYNGISSFITMDTLLYDGIHHIDMHMKLLDEETILVGQYPVNVSDYQRIENTVNYLSTLTNSYGRPYRIIRIPMPADASGRYPPQSYYLTYVNALIVNKTVLVPVYNLPTDAAALQIWREALPGYRILGFDCNAIIPQSGAIHCITKEIGVREPMRIRHKRLWEVADTTNSYRIEGTVRVRSGVDSVFLFWRADSTAGFTRAQMTDTGGVYVAQIPAQTAGSRVSYFIEATSFSGRRSTFPFVGEAGAFTFTVKSSPTSVPLEVAGRFRLDNNYPNPFNPSTTIRFEIPASGIVTLKVLDVLGREAATLVERMLESGSHTAAFDASRFSSGVYFYSLESAGRRISKPMLLLK